MFVVFFSPYFEFKELFFLRTLESEFWSIAGLIVRLLLSEARETSVGVICRRVTAYMF